jgi:hypothetical protein
MGWTFVFHEFMQIKSGAFYPPSVDVVFFTVKINSYVPVSVQQQVSAGLAVIKRLACHRHPRQVQQPLQVSGPGQQALACPAPLAQALRGFFLRLAEPVPSAHGRPFAPWARVHNVIMARHRRRPVGVP